MRSYIALVTDALALAESCMEGVLDLMRKGVSAVVSSDVCFLTRVFGDFMVHGSPNMQDGRGGAFPA